MYNEESSYRTVFELLQAGAIGAGLGLMQGLLIVCAIRARHEFPAWTAPVLLSVSAVLLVVVTLDMLLYRSTSRGRSVARTPGAT